VLKTSWIHSAASAKHIKHQLALEHSMHPLHRATQMSRVIKMNDGAGGVPELAAVLLRCELSMQTRAGSMAALSTQPSKDGTKFC